MTEKPKTYIDPTTNKWVTDDFGRLRDATPEEIEATLQQWENTQDAGNQESDD